MNWSHNVNIGCLHLPHNKMDADRVCTISQFTPVVLKLLVVQFFGQKHRKTGLVLTFCVMQ